jgi:archaemetzincin
MPITIQLRPLQPLDDSLINSLTATIAHKFSLPCVFDQRPFSEQQLRAAYYPDREQYLAAPLLQQLKWETAATTLATLGVLKEDLFTEGKRFIFGEAEVGGKVALISIARLAATSSWIASNQAKSNHAQAWATKLSLANRLAVHELGHVFALRHCPQPRCVMQFSPQIADLMRKSSQFCPDCAHTVAENLLKFWPANSR